ncbi:MAG: glycosyltransferase family 4 protein [Bacteroidales bacterium]
MKYDICIFTSTHCANDTRVFGKQITSFLEAGYSVLYYTNHCGSTNKPLELIDSAYSERLKVIYNSGFRIENRIGRFLRSLSMFFWISNKCRMYHFHDPDLIFCGFLLRLAGRKVIYDVHEDYIATFSEKPYLSPIARRVISNSYRMLEAMMCKWYTAIVTATPAIRESYIRRGFKRVETIHNFPYSDELLSNLKDEKPGTRKNLLYVGVITEIRGFTNLVLALEKANVTTPLSLILAGPILPESYALTLSKMKGWRYVHYLGPISRMQMREELGKAKFGVCLFKPMKNHLEAMPNKIFEYMSAGLPVLCSNFELWKSLVLDNGVGMVCDPMDIDSISDALVSFSNLPETTLETMGEKGKLAIQEKYCWDTEKEKLLELYKSFGVVPEAEKVD